MQFLIANWYLVVAALVSGGLLAWPALSGRSAGGGRVSPADAVQLINRERAVLIDVSDAAEYAAGHPIGARSVPLAQLATAGAALPKNKALPLVVVCATGARSAKAVETLKGLGFDNTRALAGGLDAWRAAQLPVERSAAA